MPNRTTIKLLAVGVLLSLTVPAWAQVSPSPKDDTRKLYYFRPPTTKPATPSPSYLPLVPEVQPNPVAAPGPHPTVQPTPVPESVAPPVLQPSKATTPISAAPVPKVEREPKADFQPKQPTPLPPGSLQLVGFETRKPVGRLGDDKSQLYTFTLPGPEVIFRLESESALKERMRQEERDKGGVTSRVLFPEQVVLSRDLYVGRSWEPMTQHVEPNFLCYQRLYFDQINFERYGWDLGILQPAICTGKFYWDVFWLPYNMGTEPSRHYECNTGYCLPGDPTPLIAYPPRLSATGAAAQAGALTGAFFIFP